MMTFRQVAVRLAGFVIGCAVGASAVVLTAGLAGVVSFARNAALTVESNQRPLSYQHGARGCGFNGYGQQYVCSDGTEGHASMYTDVGDHGGRARQDDGVPSLGEELASARRMLSRDAWHDGRTGEDGERIIAEFGDGSEQCVRIFRVTKTRFFEVTGATLQHALDIEAIEDGDLAKLDGSSFYSHRAHQ